MKKLQLLSLLMFVCTLSFGQNLTSGLLIKDLDAKYIEVHVKPRKSGKALYINYGQTGGRDILLGEDGKRFIFNNDIHIINFFYKKGYDFLYQDIEQGYIRFIKYEE